MKLYNLMVGSLIKGLKYVIFLSPSLKKVYLERYRIDQKSPVITLGINKYHEKDDRSFQDKVILGFIGVIRKEQGLDLLFSYLRENENLSLEVVGDGYHLQYYKKLARKLKLTKKVKFFGVVEDFSEIFKKWDIGVAPYKYSENNLSRYAEPTKIKDYLSYGLPVITTKATYFAGEIDKYEAGVVIDDNIESFAGAVDKITKSYKNFLEGVSKLVDKYEYRSWYNKKFTFLKKS
jgi:glycosyltransferase involved in cell wall biosynthesis